MTLFTETFQNPWQSMDFQNQQAYTRRQTRVNHDGIRVTRQPPCSKLLIGFDSRAQRSMRSRHDTMQWQLSITTRKPTTVLSPKPMLPYQSQWYPCGGRYQAAILYGMEGRHNVEGCGWSRHSGNRCDDESAVKGSCLNDRTVVRLHYSIGGQRGCMKTYILNVSE